MKTLNLVYPEQSDIKYRVDKFPDGQQQIVIEKLIEQRCILDDLSHFIERTVNNSDIIQIKSRLNNFRDLELIICVTKSLRNLGVKEIHLYTPYFLGSRSDRQFEEGSNNYLKDVICPIINRLKFESVTVLDPHSYVLEACLNNFRKRDNSQLVKFTIMNASIHPGKMILVSPDDGASKKIYKLAEQIGYKGDIIICSKDRDVEGKIVRVNVPYKEGQFFDKDIIIIDDICDGGATFINISKEIKRITEGFKYQPKIYLVVTHGIFSKGFEELSKYFDGIYCTNSYGDALAQRDGDLQYQKLVKQLNVF